jgi:DivIVA domain-containing protein
MDPARLATGRLATTWWREGYERVQVDRFLNHVRRALASGAGRVTAAEVESVLFHATRFRRGYRIRDVDALLDEVAAYLRAREGAGS